MSESKVTVRFAPSPTGKLHLGSCRTAVFNWLYARHSGGRFILRIEDTDLSRSQEAYTQSFLNDMKWLGMDYDEFHKQSDRFPLYREYCDRLVKEGKAYVCGCTREAMDARAAANGAEGETALRYDGHCRDRHVEPGNGTVVRLLIGEDRYIQFKDAVKGKISINTKELDDFVIMKSDGSPTYNFAVVIDDALMGVNTVIRGEDHITNTFKQIALYEILGFPVPRFAHLPLVMDKDKTPLSKRKGSTNIEYYRKMGILPHAVLNAIARLGWGHGNDEVFTLDKLIEYFDIDKLNKSNAVYDEEKMVWVNGKHMKMAALDKILADFDSFLAEAGLEKTGKMADPAWLSVAVETLRGRNSTLAALYNEILLFAVPHTEVEPEALEIYKSLIMKPGVDKTVRDTIHYIESITDFSTVGHLYDKLKVMAEMEHVSFADLAGVLRVLLTGRKNTPDITTVIRLLDADALPLLKRKLIA